MKLIVPGVPVAQIRMKHSARHGFSRIYDPRSKEKKEIKHFIGENFDLPFFDHPVASFVFHMPIPASTPKKLLTLYNSGRLKHEKKPDVDNFLKLYLDCMDGIMFEGDQKVSLGPCIKLYHPEPKTIIILKESTHILSLEEFRFLFSSTYEESEICSSPEMAFPHDFYIRDSAVSLQSLDNF